MRFLSERIIKKLPRLPRAAGGADMRRDLLPENQQEEAGEAEPTIPGPLPHTHIFLYSQLPGVSYSYYLSHLFSHKQ